MPGGNILAEIYHFQVPWKVIGCIWRPNQRIKVILLDELRVREPRVREYPQNTHNGCHNALRQGWIGLDVWSQFILWLPGLLSLGAPASIAPHVNGRKPLKSPFQLEILWDSKTKGIQRRRMQGKERLEELAQLVNCSISTNASRSVMVIIIHIAWSELTSSVADPYRHFSHNNYRGGFAVSALPLERWNRYKNMV